MNAYDAGREKYLSQAEKVERGMLINMDHEHYCTDIVAVEDSEEGEKNELD